MNFTIIRLERIVKLQKRLQRIDNALKNYPYKNERDVREDFAAYAATEKEIQIQQAYLLLEA